MTQSEPVQFTATLTLAGYRGVLLHLSALKLRLVVPLLAFFGFAALGTGFNTQAFLTLGSLFATLITVWGYIAWNTRAPNNVELYLPVAYEVGPSEVIFAGEAGQGVLAWQQIRKWRYASGHYLLYVAGASYVMIPEIDIAPADLDRFEALLWEQVPKGPRKRFR